MSSLTLGVSGRELVVMVEGVLPDPLVLGVRNVRYIAQGTCVGRNLGMQVEVNSMGR